MTCIEGYYANRALEEDKIRDIFGWDESICPVALLPVGYPDEALAPRKRFKIEEIIID